MANTITAVLPTVYEALNNVSRELIGMTRFMQRDTKLERVAVGQTVTVPIVPPATGGNITPGSVPPDDGDQTFTNMTLTITKSKYSPIRWNGEEQLALGPTGQYNAILARQFTQSMRWLANQVEVDAVTAAYQAASRAAGTAGTTPFATANDLSDLAAVNRILDDNGAPMQGRAIVLGSAARQNLESKQGILLKVNEAGTNDLLRNRVMDKVLDFNFGFTGMVPTTVPGTGSGITTSGALAAGTTTITTTGGTGTIVAGDVVTFAGDSNKYVVVSGLTGGSFKIGTPGLRGSIASGTAITVGGAYVPNVAFTEDALVLAARAPAMPAGGDSADDRTYVTDPVSGISFEVALYREYRRIRYEVALAWGVGVPNPANIAILMG
ncbi:P22 phage major capsid protein family protein [Roseomonas chloroacetimidivorans]|uniref:P22 phage major capsid protein family protein n=1 Tax=Roseomonas chloroacetimidivorans TaxID=1766656 RepID=UPI003C78A698